jgi:hypothetical protein
MNFEEVVKDVVEAPVKLIEWGSKAEKVLATAIAEQPELKTVLTQLVTKAESIGTAALSAGGSSGLNLTADEAVLADATDLFIFVKNTVAPLVESIYGQIKSDVAS